MKTGAALMGAFAVVGSLVAAPCQSAQAVGSFYIHAGIGYATQSLSDVNDDIKAFRSDLQTSQSMDNILSFQWEPYGGAANFDTEVGYRFSKLVAAGIGFAYQHSSVEHVAEPDFFDLGSGQYLFGTLEEKPELSLLDVGGNVTLWVPSAPGLHFGGALGLARGTRTLTDAVDILYGDALVSGFTTAAGKGEWHATGVTFGAFAGYEVFVAPKVSLLGRLGYRYWKVGKMNGSYTVAGEDENGPIVGTFNEPPSDSNDVPLEFDLSGLYLKVGVGVSLGGPR